MPVLYLVEQGATLRKEAGLLTVTKDAQVLSKVPAAKVEQVVIFGNVNLTTPVIGFLLREGIDCVFLSSEGKYHGRLVSSESGFGLLRQKQLAASLDQDVALRIAREMVRGKLLNQRTFLMRYRLDREAPEIDAAVQGIHASLERASRARSTASLQGQEGMASALYYRAFKRVLKRDLGFEGRNRRPPRDPVNSMLSFGYTLLSDAVQSAVRTVGLDPFIGFLHAVEYSRPSLVLDLMEEFRTIVVDSVVARLVNSGLVDAADFRQSEEEKGALLLSEPAMKRFLQHFEERLKTEIVHPDTGHRVSYRRCFELQGRRLARVLLGHDELYGPFVVK